MNQSTQTKTCKDCNITVSTNNTTNSQLKLSNPRCKDCIKKRNAKNNPKNNEKKRSIIMNTPLIDTRFNEQQHQTAGWETIYEEHLNPREIPFDTLPLVVSSAMGTGKTQILIDTINNNPNKNIVYLTVNHSTIDSTYERLHKEGIDFLTHLDPRLEEENFKEKRKLILITPDSYHKIKDPEILVLDEVNSILAEMSQKLNSTPVYSKEAQGIGKSTQEIKFSLLESYNRIIRHPKYVLLDVEIPYWMFWSQPVRKIKNLYRKEKEINIFKPQPYLREKFKQKIKDTLKTSTGQILIQSTSKSFLKKLYEELKDSLYDMILITGDTENVSKVSSEEMNQYRVILASPVISRGVSLKADIVFLYDSGRVVHPYVTFQMVDRARNSRVINIALEEHKDPIDKNTYLYQKCKSDLDFNHPLYKFEREQLQLLQDRVGYVISLLQMNYRNKKNTSSYKGKIDSIIRLMNQGNQEIDNNWMEAFISKVSKDDLISKVEIERYLNTAYQMNTLEKLTR